MHLDTFKYKWQYEKQRSRKHSMSWHYSFEALEDEIWIMNAADSNHWKHFLNEIKM